jgi:hypothetical protein
MDRRKARITGQPGALWVGRNGHISRGGDFECRKKFVSTYALPANTTKGLAVVAGQLFVFGASASPGTIPAGVNYQRLQHPSSGSAAITEIKSVTSFSGKLYVVALFDDGNTYHYYDGARVTAWDSIAAAVSSNNAVATALAARIDAETTFTASAVGAVATITAAVAGTPFSISQSTINGGSNPDQTITLAETQANRVAVAEQLAIATLTVTGGTNNPGVNRITGITINGVQVLGANVNWATSNSATATAIAAQITSYSSTPEYTAVAVGPVVTISAAAGTGAGPNGFVVTPTNGGDMTTSNTNMGGGITAVTAQAQIATATIGGTFEAADIFTINLNSTDYTVSGAAAGTGTMALTYQQKIYSVTNSLLYFSALNSPASPGAGVGGGFINMANQNEGNETLITLQEYQGKLAIFSRNSIRIWNMDVDPALNVFQQTVQNSGALSSRSVIPYGNIDVFYLNDSGVRSLRARDSSNSPAVNDVGVAIDPFLREYLDTLSDTQIQRAVAIIEPLDSRYWLAVAKRIFVFSYFPGSKINAWTYYDLSPELGSADISEVVKVNNQVFVRAADTIYLYGGAAGATYPTDADVVAGAYAELATPYLSAGTPATWKGTTGFDIGVEGTWKADLLIDPSDESVEVPVGTFNKPTFAQPKMATSATPTPMFAMKLRTTKGGYSRISMLAAHYKAEQAQ